MAVPEERASLGKPASSAKTESKSGRSSWGETFISKCPPRSSNKVRKHSHYSQKGCGGGGGGQKNKWGKEAQNPASLNKNKKLQISTGMWTCHSLEHRVLGEGLGDFLLSKHRLLALQAARSHYSPLQTTHLKSKQRLAVGAAEEG